MIDTYKLKEETGENWAGTMVNDTEKVLFILHWRNLHREILLSTPQIVDVSS